MMTPLFIDSLDMQGNSLTPATDSCTGHNPFGK